MGGSWKIGTLRGIGIYVHWTFWVLVLFYLMSATAQSGLAAGIQTVILILAVFACILAHELGHAAAAAWFGIPTTDITLLPIGGLARLARLPNEPWQEFVIAVAGPAVNVVIAFALLLAGAIGIITIVSDSGPAGSLNELGFFGQLCVVNIGLVIFNMLPAFPMDGGRVLRSLLAMVTGHMRATEIAARVGRWMALIFLIAALVYGQIGLMLVALFIFFAGTAELFEARRRAAVGSTWVRWDWTPGQPTNWGHQNTDPWTITTSDFNRPNARPFNSDGDIIDQRPT